MLNVTDLIAPTFAESFCCHCKRKCNKFKNKIDS
ncbi:hypothetical protein TcasGA2_TC031572 [Tribolium castaneum]|uniref:Uncharacterized protein n=1 Tax=Tribolium castaneum TaxID=7070 RepID=A0A139WPM4_TRICA|nr:hypothetical protein TcasGA2_TC031572 [Tribolium castaneum]